MPFRKPHFLVLGILAFGPLACGGRGGLAGVAPAGGTSPAITVADLRKRLYLIADDSMMGREAGRLGNYEVTAYIASEAKRFGLEPAGDSGTFFQTIPLFVRIPDSASTLAVAGSTLELWKDFLPVPPVQRLPVSLGASVEGFPVVFGGTIGDSTMALGGEQVAGKVVVLDAARDPAGQRAFSLAGLARFGSAAALLVANLDYAPPGVVEYLSEPQAFLRTGPPPAGRPAAAMISQSAAVRILGRPLDELSPGAAGRPMAGYFGFVDAPPERPARNVVAVLRGRDPALRHEYVAIGAHTDHIGIAAAPVDHDSLRAWNTIMRPLGADTRNPGQPAPEQAAAIRYLLDSLRALRPPRPDSIYNGADDDGSGTVTVLEIAEALVAGPRPARSILFVWHTAEEKGLWGSQWFTDHPTVPRDSIVAQLNMDMVGRGLPLDLAKGPPILEVIGARRLSTELGDVIERVNAGRQHPVQFDWSFDANGHPLNRYCRSDHYMYARYGIPIAFFSAGKHQDYHMVTDEPQYINYPHMAVLADFIKDVALGVANLDHRLVVDKPRPDPLAPCRQ